jgi:hypothetical protein
MFLTLVWGELFLIMLGNKMGFTLTKMILYVLFIEHMNPLKCIWTKTNNRKVKIGIIISWKEGTHMITILLTNHWNSMGVVVPPNTMPYKI